MPEQVSFIGAGRWACALALCADMSSTRVGMWGRTLHSFRAKVPCAFRTLCLEEVLRWSPRWVMGVPAQSLRGVLADMKALSVPPPELIVLTCKGLEKTSGRLMSQVLQEFFPTVPWAYITGPNLADEVLKGVPSGVTVASDQPEICEKVMGWFAKSPLILEACPHPVACEIHSALKNVMAIGYGLLSQVCSDKNTQATFLTLALRDVVGLANVILKQENHQPVYLEDVLCFGGMGDFWLTCTSLSSRNARFGMHFPQPIVHADSGDHLVEGLPSLEAALHRMEAHKVIFPVIQGIGQILSGRVEKSAWLSCLLP